MPAESASDQEPCKLCGAAAWRLAYRQGDHDQFSFWRCGQCGLVVNGSPAESSQEKYVLTDFGRPRAASAGLRQSWETIRQAHPVPGRLLDLGCGAGAVLLLARDAGWTVTGTELDPVHVRRMQGQLRLDVLCGGIEVVPGRERFDVVVMRHVLEHVLDPVGAIRRIEALLVPGGTALLEFPNIDGTSASVAGSIVPGSTAITTRLRTAPGISRSSTGGHSPYWSRRRV